jgi:tRNA(Ile)-lysidine synthase TilS/MesJ
MIKFEKNIFDKAHSLHKSKNRVTLLVSGGVDSIAGAHYFLKNFVDEDNIFYYTIYHYNHKVQEINIEMEKTVKKFHEDLFPDVPISFHSRDEDDSEQKITEDYLRSLRFNSMTKLFYHRTYITFHHLDDFVESYLLNVFRGKENYLPMPFWSIHDNDNITCKPFCLTKKIDFIKYAEKNNLMKYVVEDPTNKISKGSRRNMIRNEIVPILKRDNVGLDTIVKKKIQHRLMLDLIK